MSTITRYSIVVGALLLAACGQRQPESNATPATSSSAPSAIDMPTADQAALEAESSLSIKRGVIVLNSVVDAPANVSATQRKDGRYRACGASADWALADQTEGMLERVYTELGGKPIYVEVYGDRDVDDRGAKTNSFNVEEVLFASANNPNAACDTPPTQYEVLARGHAPTWSVEVTQDAMVFRQTIAPTEITFASIDTADAEGTVTYRAGVDKHVLELTVAQHACRDAGNGDYYGYTASAKLDKQSLNGCARVGE